jgi:hypothetical protein
MTLFFRDFILVSSNCTNSVTVSDECKRQLKNLLSPAPDPMSVFFRYIRLQTNGFYPTEAIPYQFY